MLKPVKDNILKTLNVTINKDNINNQIIVSPFISDTISKKYCDGLCVLGFTNKVYIKCHQNYTEELNNIYLDYEVKDFFEVNNLSMLDDILRQDDFLLCGPYQVLHCFEKSDINQDFDKRFKFEFVNGVNDKLHQYEGFDNALSYDDGDNTEVSLVVWQDKLPICIVTATKYVNEYYSIGISVNKDYRRMGIATEALIRVNNYLISNNITPHYEVSINNIASIKLALKANYVLNYTLVYSSK